MVWITFFEKCYKNKIKGDRKIRNSACLACVWRVYVEGNTGQREKEINSDQSSCLIVLNKTYCIESIVYIITTL